jgi:outer membrane protein assembly factor BamB
MKKFALFFFIIGNLCFITHGQEATRWRGPNADGIYHVGQLLPVWPAEGPQILWTFNGLGKGFSSPVFANNNIYINGMIDGQAVFFELDQNGKELRQIKYGKEFEESYPGVRSSPTIVGKLAYLLTGNGKIVCLDLEKWKPVWEKELFSQMDGGNITWGITETPVIEGNLLFLTPGGKTNNVVALNRMTGETVWNCSGLGELSAYCTPLLVKLPARQLLVTHMANHVLGIDASTGKLLWTFEHPNQWAAHANTPLFYDGGIVLFSGWGQGSEKLRLSADGSQITKEWVLKSFDSRQGGAVIINGFLYGSGDADRSWQCIDWKTGEKKYSSQQFFKGVVIAANNQLIGYTEKGELFLAEANPAEFKVISNTKVTAGTEQHWAHPVIEKAILYIRHGNALIAYKIAK